MNILKKILTNLYKREDVVCVASSPRSGSTWMAETLVRAGAFDWVDEPLGLKGNKGELLRDAGFRARTCIDDADSARRDAVLACMDQVLRGRVGWLQLHPTLRRRLLLKFVRINRMLGPVVEKFHLKRNILLIRHPCAVVSSQLNMHGGKAVWSSVSGPAPDIPEDLSDNVAALRNGSTARSLAINWAIDQLHPIYRSRPANTMLVFYEDLIRNSDEEWSRICSIAGADVKKILDKPSKTVSSDFKTSSQLDKWKDQLPSEVIDDILSTCHCLGVDLYDDRPMPIKYPWT